MIRIPYKRWDEFIPNIKELRKTLAYMAEIMS